MASGGKPQKVRDINDELKDTCEIFQNEIASRNYDRLNFKNAIWTDSSTQRFPEDK